MTPSIAAAKRLRERKQDGSLWAYSLDGNHCCCCTQQSREWIEEVLAAYEAITDDTPLDEAWLRSVGFRDEEGRLACGTLRTTSGLWFFVSSKCVPIRQPRTRGAVRLLAMALGVTLKEGGE